MSISQRDLYKAFKSKGLSLNNEATQLLLRTLRCEADQFQSLANVLAEIKLRIEKHEVVSSIITGEVIASVVAELSTDEEDIKKNSTQLIDAFNSPKIIYDEFQKNYKLLPAEPRPLFGDVQSRADMFRQRLLFSQHRLLRSGLFTLKGLSSRTARSDAHEISTIASLLGYKGVSVLFGMVTQPEEGSYYLEDLTGTIRLDLSNCKFEHKLFAEGCLVVVQGEVVNDRYCANAMMFPPAESREASLEAMNVEDVFGNGTRSSHQRHMQKLEEEEVDSLFVIVSDVQLDNQQCLEKLQQLFQGFEETGSSPLFILIGTFISKPLLSLGGREAYTAAFSALADIIVSCPILCSTAKFVFVPGPRDYDICPLYPRKPIPQQFVEELSKKVSHVNFTTNPARIRFFTQEIVIYREELLRKFQRNSIAPQSKSKAVLVEEGLENLEESAADNVIEELVKCVVQQAHLCPLPIHTTPIYWEYDHAFRLTPLPHLLILASKQQQYSFVASGCLTVNPGSFVADSSFVVYRPSSREIEFSQIS